MKIGGRMKKVTILVLHLGYGGIESAVSSLANLLCKEYTIEIVSIYKLYDVPAFTLDKRIQVTYLIESDLPKRLEKYKLFLFKGKGISLCKAIWKDYLCKGKIGTLCKDTFQGFSMYKKRREVMEQFVKQCDSDILLSTRDFLNQIVASYGKKEALKIGWEHNHHNGNEKYSTKIIESAKNLDYLVLVSKELHAFYQEKLQNEICKPIYIPNFIEKIPKEKSSVQSNHIVTVGRLSKEKGHLDLIEVMDKVHKEGIPFHLDIIGAGPEEESIQKAIVNYDLTDFITMHGFLSKENMDPIMKEASLFVLPSYTESFGIVILEAMSYGIPCLAFDSAQGASEIIEDNWDGYLVANRDKERMAKRIVQLLKSPNRRVVMSSNALKKAKKFTGTQVKKEWVKLFEKEK